MPFIRVPSNVSRWRQPPSYVVRPAQSRLLDRLMFMGSASTGTLYDMTGRGGAVAMKASVTQGGLYGVRSWKFDGTQVNSDAGWGEDHRFEGQTEITMAAVGVVDSLAANSWLLSACWPDGAGIQVTTGGYIRFFAKNSAYSNCDWLSSNTLSVGQLVTVAACARGGQVGSVCLNGVLNSPTSTNSFDSLPTGTHHLQFGRAHDGGPLTGHVMLGLVTARAWTDTELVSFCRDPFQVVRERQSAVWWASSLSPTLSAATVTNITTTTATPRVTITFP